jgi:radical SAM protein with 4Fe4S-binding SPASM domain
MSEPTLDNRLCDIITMFKERGFQTFLHSNGDIMRKDQSLCDSLSKVCDIFRIGIYDLQDEKDIAERQQWWQNRLSPLRTTIFSVSTVRFQRRFSLDDGEHNSYPNSYCTEPNRCIVIYYDGEVALCCEDINCDFGLGNTFETSIKDIWTSPHRLEIAKKIMERRSHYPVCAACPITPR